MNDRAGTPASVPGPQSVSEALTLAKELQRIARQESVDMAALRGGLDRLVAFVTDLPHGGPADAAPAPDPGEVEALRTELNRVVQETASFASLMVHEIRKPMTTIRGYVDMLAKPAMIGPLNDMQTQFITTIRTNVLRMEALVSDISDISKLNSGRLRLDPKMTTFSQIMPEVEKLAAPLASEYGQTVTYDVPQGLPILNVDFKQFPKVIFYLLRNAIQYTPRSTGQITLKAERLDGNILRVTITDNGIGMSAAEIARLGELFYRADQELVSSERGYGLGIPIVMGMLRLMGGTFLPVISEPGKGSTFGFTLPGIG